MHITPVEVSVVKVHQFIPLAVLLIAAVCALASEIGVPIAPIGVIATAGCIVIALLLEDRKWGDFLVELIHVFKFKH